MVVITRTIQQQYQPGYSVREVEEIIGACRKTLYPRIRSGELRAYTALDGTLRVSEEELVRYMREIGE